VALCHVYTLLPFTNGQKETWNNLWGTMESTFAMALAAQHLNTGNGTIVPQVEGLSQRCPVRFSLEFSDTELSAQIGVRNVIGAIRRRDFNDVSACWANDNNNITNSNILHQTDDNTILDSVEQQQQLQQQQRPVAQHDNHQTQTGIQSVEPCFLLGAARSSVSIPTSIVTGIAGYPQLSAISTSAALNDKSQHPLFGRTIPSDDGTSIPFILYMRDILHVQYLGVIHINDSYGSAFGQGLQAAAQLLAPDMVVQAVEIPIDATQESIQNAVKILKETGFAYFFGILFPTRIVDAVMEEAYRQGIQGDSNHQWFFSDSVGPEIVSRTFPRESVLAKSFYGTGLISASAGSAQFNPKLEKLSDALKWLRTNPADMAFIDSILPTHSDSPDFAAFDLYGPDFLQSTGLQGPFLYDAMIAAGLAACDVYNSGDGELTGAAHFQAIAQQDFLGTTGRIRLDPATGSREVTSTFFQILNYVTDERTTPTDLQLKPVLTSVFKEGEWVQLEDYVYTDGTTNVPPDVIPVDVERNHFTPGVRAGGLTMCSIVIAMAVGFMGWTKWHESHKVVMASQPIFLYLIAFGTIVFSSAIIPLSYDDGVASTHGCDIACQVIPWLMSIGFTLIFSALYTKTYRINQILNGAKHFKRIKVTVWQVAKPMMVLLGLNVIVLVLSTVLSPLYWDFHVDREDSFGQPVEGYGLCAFEDAMPYLVALGVLNIGALCFAILEAYRARNISIQYAESQYIFSASVSILMICCFGIPILLLAEKGNAYFFVFSAVIFCCSCAILLFIFVPKIQYVIEEDRMLLESELGPVSMNFASEVFSERPHGHGGHHHHHGPHISGLDLHATPATPAISEHESEDDDDDDGHGIKIITERSQDQLLRDNKILKTKLKLALDGGRGALRLNIPMPSEDLINFRVSGLASGLAGSHVDRRSRPDNELLVLDSSKPTFENEPLDPTLDLTQDSSGPISREEAKMLRESVVGAQAPYTISRSPTTGLIAPVQSSSPKESAPVIQEAEEEEPLDEAGP